MLRPMSFDPWGLYMSTDSLPSTQPVITYKSEVYNRESNGQLSPRVGFLSDLLNRLHPQTDVKIQVNISVDLTAITTRLDALPVELRKRDLNVAYNEIKKRLANYLDYGKPDLLNNLFNSCQEHSPSFEQCIKEQSSILNPNEALFKDRLAEFEAICDAYATVLGIYLFSATRLYAECVERETAIKEHLDEISKTLYNLIHRTLVPSGRYSPESLLVRSFINKDNNRFNEYFRYSGFPNTPDGAKKLLIAANGEKPYHRGIHIDAKDTMHRLYGGQHQQHPQYAQYSQYEYDALLADRAIELLKNFDAVYTARVNYKYEAGTQVQAAAS